MNDQKKCQAQGGPASCDNPRCPERQAFMDSISLPSQFTALSALAKPSFDKAWTNKDTVLFQTIHGSKLYGLSHADSDDDYYRITPTRYVTRKLNAKHKITGDEDVVTVDFASFTKLCQEGSPQALEAMFSRKAVSPFFESYRKNWFASDPNVVAKYIRTIHSFSLNETEKQEKYRRHALRLSFNLDELVHTGRFNPTLSPQQVRIVKTLALKDKESYLTELNAVNPFDLDWTHQ